MGHDWALLYFNLSFKIFSAITSFFLLPNAASYTYWTLTIHQAEADSQQRPPLAPVTHNITASTRVNVGCKQKIHKIERTTISKGLPKKLASSTQGALQ